MRKGGLEAVLVGMGEESVNQTVSPLFEWFRLNWHTHTVREAPLNQDQF